MLPYLDIVLRNIKESLAARASKASVKTLSDSPIFECISMLAIAVGPLLTKYLTDLLDQLFSGSLTEALRQALVDLSHHVPAFLPIIQGKE